MYKVRRAAGLLLVMGAAVPAVARRNEISELLTSRHLGTALFFVY